MVVHALVYTNTVCLAQCYHKYFTTVSELRWLSSLARHAIVLKVEGSNPGVSRVIF